jgi:hypothetical protein
VSSTTSPSTTSSESSLDQDLDGVVGALAEKIVRLRRHQLVMNGLGDDGRWLSELAVLAASLSAFEFLVGPTLAFTWGSGWTSAGGVGFEPTSELPR